MTGVLSAVGALILGAGVGSFLTTLIIEKKVSSKEDTTPIASKQLRGSLSSTVVEVKKKRKKFDEVYEKLDDYSSRQQKSSVSGQGTFASAQETPVTEREVPLSGMSGSSTRRGHEGRKFQSHGSSGSPDVTEALESLESIDMRKISPPRDVPPPPSQSRRQRVEESEEYYTSQHSIEPEEHSSRTDSYSSKPYQEEQQGEYPPQYPEEQWGRPQQPVYQEEVQEYPQPQQSDSYSTAPSYPQEENQSNTWEDTQQEEKQVARVYRMSDIFQFVAKLRESSPQYFTYNKSACRFDSVSNKDAPYIMLENETGKYMIPNETTQFRATRLQDKPYVCTAKLVSDALVLERFCKVNDVGQIIENGRIVN